MRAHVPRLGIALLLLAGCISVDQGPLSPHEVQALLRQIGGCWSLPAGLERGQEDMLIQLRVQVHPDGTVRQITLQDQARADRDPVFRAVAESARDAIERCGPLQLPPEKYALWRDMILKFRPHRPQGRGA